MIGHPGSAGGDCWSASRARARRGVEKLVKIGSTELQENQNEIRRLRRSAPRHT
jgi:hypothetical protein